MKVRQSDSVQLYIKAARKIENKAHVKRSSLPGPIDQSEFMNELKQLNRAASPYRDLRQSNNSEFNQTVVVD